MTTTPPITYDPAYLPEQEANALLDTLRTTLPWQQKRMKMLGRDVAFPRLMSWHGDHDYVFSGSTQEAQPWTPELAALRDRLEATTGARYNSVLANLYRDGQDSISWHADDEPGLGLAPTIASISLGAERTFKMRHSASRLVYDVELSHGSLVVMYGSSQREWQHSVPKRKRVTEPRINLTFRWFEPPASRRDRAMPDRDLSS